MFTKYTLFVNVDYIFSGYTILNQKLRNKKQKEKGVVWSGQCAWSAESSYGWE